MANAKCIALIHDFPPLYKNRLGQCLSNKCTQLAQPVQYLYGMVRVVGEVVKQYEGESTTFENFTYDSYKEKPLGTFIESEVLSGKKRRKGAYATESGTISDKVTFCQKAIDAIKNFEDLSPEAQKLTQKIYEFIEKNNR